MHIKIINKTVDGIPDDVERAILENHTAWSINDACDTYNLKISEIEINDDVKTYTVVNR